MKKTLSFLFAALVLAATAGARTRTIVVNPGQSINQAIRSVTETDGTVIYIKNGIYNEKVIVDRPGIWLVGEDRDSTRIFFPELSSQRTIREYNGKPVGNGVIVLQEGADDCVIARMTVHNNYGSTVEATTAHQMAIFGRATRTIVTDCNVWADGNDALALWAEGGDGMYYHTDLEIRCPGVDFLCPRGWCYAQRIHFIGDGPAQIWHDGRGDRSKKLVIRDSRFDADSHCILGRYHHDAQFYLIDCTMTDLIVDHEIGYAYSDKVLDPCEWGNRVYMHNVHRDGGDFKWLRDNLHEAEGAPTPEEITPRWTFNSEWDPEAVLARLAVALKGK